jgi:outer membrane murein-binding lipoprotein Lpp
MGSVVMLLGAVALGGLRIAGPASGECESGGGVE